MHYVQAATEDSNLTGINAIYSMEIKKQEQGENNTEKSLVINKVTEDYGDKVLIETTYIPEVGLSREIKFIVPKESLWRDRPGSGLVKKEIIIPSRVSPDISINNIAIHDIEEATNIYQQADINKNNWFTSINYSAIKESSSIAINIELLKHEGDINNKSNKGFWLMPILFDPASNIQLIEGPGYISTENSELNINKETNTLATTYSRWNEVKLDACVIGLPE